MNRLGELIKSQRAKYGMTAKQLAKKCGVTESFVLEIESGKRIANDVIATRLLKAMGAPDPLSDMSAGAEEKPQARPAPLPKKQDVKQAPPEKQGEVQTVWMDALSGLVKRVPVRDITGKNIGARLLAVEEGKIEGAPADKVFYLRLDDDSLRFFRLMKGDLLLCAPYPQLVDGEVMFFKLNGAFMCRKLRKMEGDKADMLWYDAGEKRESFKISEAGDFARILRVEFLPYGT